MLSVAMEYVLSIIQLLHNDYEVIVYAYSEWQLANLPLAPTHRLSSISVTRDRQKSLMGSASCMPKSLGGWLLLYLVNQATQ